MCFVLPLVANIKAVDVFLRGQRKILLGRSYVPEVIFISQNNQLYPKIAMSLCCGHFIARLDVFIATRFYRSLARSKINQKNSKCY